MSKKDTIIQPEWDLVIAPGRAEKNYWKDLWYFLKFFLFKNNVILSKTLWNNVQ